MKMKDKERIIFTPGLDSRSLKMDYYEIDNMVIVGTTGSGKTTALNAIVKSMIESNSSEYLSLVLFDGQGNMAESPFFNVSRVTPYTELMKLIGLCPGMFYHTVYDILYKLYLMSITCSDDLGERMGLCIADAKFIPGKLVVVINEFEALPLYLKYIIRYIIETGTPQIKFILTGQSEAPFKDLLPNIKYRITTRVQEETSNILLGCNIGNRRADRYGSCWFVDISEPDCFTKHVVNFIPESLLNRMMKSYSSGKSSSNKLIQKYYSMHGIEYDVFKLNNVLSTKYKIDASMLFNEFLTIANKEECDTLIDRKECDIDE